MTDPGDFFDTVAARYDRVFAPSYRDTARDLAAITERLCPGALVVDAGCGTGRAFPHLCARGARVVALDTSSSMLRAAGARASAPSVARVRCDLARRWPLRDGVADALVALHAVFAHPIGDPWALLRHVGAEIARVVRHGGLVAIDLPEPSFARASLTSLGGDWYRHVEPDGATIDAFVPEPSRALEALGLPLALAPCAHGVRASGVTSRALRSPSSRR